MYLKLCISIILFDFHEYNVLKKCCLFCFLGENYGCGGTLRLNQTYTNSSYILKPPTFPTNTDLDCGWLILVEPSYVVQIQVVSYTEIPDCHLNTTDCKCSSIQVRYYISSIN